jgi:outer membrane protein OmpA-like peptidoglycan-associated protein
VCSKVLFVVRVFVCVFVFVLTVIPKARAQGVQVQFSTRVATGDRPKVTFVATEPLSSLSVELQDESGKQTRARFTGLPRGASRTVTLPAEPGRHRYSGQVVVTRRDQRSESPLTFETVVAPRLEIQIDKAKVDLKARRLEARFSRPAARAEVTLYGTTGGEPLARAEQPLEDRAPGAPLEITWPAPRGDVEVGRIDLRLYDADGFYGGVSLYPWSVYIPHEEVNFATDSSAIAPAEAPKLQASLSKIADALARHRQLGPIKLYIAGHTDTVGTEAYNRQLSLKRARAIAGWFRTHGLRLPILFEGFGEQAPLVGTPDDTDEVRNRRVDYILAVEDPVLKATAFRAQWKALP